MAGILAEGFDLLKSVGGSIVSAVGNWGKITEGPLLQKQAAAVAALRAIGYTDDQIKNEPVLRSVVTEIGSYPMTIDTVVSTGLSKTKGALTKYNAPIPKGSAGSYSPPKGGPSAQSYMDSFLGQRANVNVLAQQAAFDQGLQNIATGQLNSTTASVVGQQVVDQVVNSAKATINSIEKQAQKVVFDAGVNIANKAKKPWWFWALVVGIPGGLLLIFLVSLFKKR